MISGENVTIPFMLSNLTYQIHHDNKVENIPEPSEVLKLRNFSALENYKGVIDDKFLLKINTYWLHYPAQSPNVHYIFACIYFIMMVIGLTGNFLVIFIFARSKNVRTPANNLVMNLAISDLLIMWEAPMFIYNSLYHGPALGDYACRLYGFLGGLGGTSAIVTLTLISIDRYNVLVFPLNPSRSTTNMRSCYMIAFIWLYSIPFALIPCLDIGLSQYVPEGFLTACSFDYLDDKTSSARIFIFIYFVFAWVIPFVSIFYCYTHILRVVLTSKKIQSNKDKSKTEIKLAVVVMSIIGLWFFAWTPYACVALLGISGYKSSISPLGSMIPGILAKISACINPFFYAVTHPRFRAELDKMLCPNKVSRSQFQTSYCTKSPNCKTGQKSIVSDCETLAMGDLSRSRQKALKTMHSIESSISVSLDYSDVVMENNP